MRVFVTGGAGFIGNWVCKQLLAEGHSVTVFDLLPSHHTEVRSLVGYIRDAALLRTSLAGHDAVIHLAAKALVPESVHDPQLYFNTNLIGGQNLLEAMRLLQIPKIVYSSSAAVYGIPQKVPIAEDDPKDPIHPYGATKYALELLLHAYHRSYGIDVTQFRYFNPYGPEEEHEPETHAVPRFICATLTKAPVSLYWKGEQERDFFYVDDLARAHVRGLHQKGFHTYNLGSGKGVKVIDLLKKIFTIAGETTAIEDLGERPGDPPCLVARITKAEKELDWRPAVSLDEGLTRTLLYFQHRRLALQGCCP